MTSNSKLLRLAPLWLPLCLAGCFPEDDRRQDELWSRILPRTRGLHVDLRIEGPDYDSGKAERCATLLQRRYHVILNPRARLRLRLHLSEQNWVTVSQERWTLVQQPRPAWGMERLCGDAIELAVRQLDTHPDLALAPPPPSPRRAPEAPPQPAAPPPPPAAPPPPAPPPPPPPAPVAREADRPEPPPPPPSPDDPPPPVERDPTDTGRAHDRRARSLYDRGELREAASEWLVAYDRDRNGAHLLHAGYAYHRLGADRRAVSDLRTARALYRRFLDRAPSSEWARLCDEVERQIVELEESER